MNADQFHKVADLFPDAALLLTRGGTVLAANRASAELGHPPKCLTGRKLTEITATDADKIADYLRLCSRSREAVVGAIEMIAADGQHIACRCHGSLIDFDSDHGGALLLLRFLPKESSPSHFAVLNQKVRELSEEIRRRRVAEERLRAQSDWLQVTLSSIGDAVVTTDGAAMVTFLNPVAEMLTGWPNTEAKGRPLGEVFRIYDEYTRHPVESPAHRVLQEGNTIGLANHTVLISRDGREIPIDDSGAPIRRPDGQVAGVVLVFRNVSEHKRAEAVLRQHVRLTRSITDNATTAIFALDGQGRVTFMNPAAESMTGFRFSEVQGQILHDLIHHTHPDGSPFPKEDCILGRIVRRGESLRNHEDFFIRRDGSIFPIRCSTTPIQINDVLTGVVLEVLDTTGEKRTADELREANHRKDEFLAMLAHELRNPLAPIRSGLDLLALTGGQAEIIEPMQQQLKHLVRLVDDLLDVARIMRGRIELKKEPIDVADAAARAIETLRPAIQAKEQTLSVSFPPQRLWIDADPVRLTQIITNLLSNAAKFTPLGGHIWLTAEKQQSDAVLQVRDTGVGIEAELLPRVFDLFTQATTTIDRAQGGLGVGLKVVKNLVELHGGSVSAWSAGPGRGSEFTVRIPVAKRDKTEEPAREIDPTISPRRILVVDDNMAAAEMLARLLTKLGTGEVFLAHDGPAALESAQEHHPDLILLDIGLPKMNGYEVVRHLRTWPDFERTLVVAVTGYGTEDDRRKSQRAGCDIHIVKPLGVDAIKQVLTHPKLQVR